MKRMTLAAALLAGTFSFAAYAADDGVAPAGTPAGEAVEAAQEATALTREGYANAAAIANLYEIEAANIAWERSSSEQVKAFAKMLIADHTAANSKLEVLVSQAEGSVPSSLDDAHQKMIDDLNAAEDAAFDGVFMAQQIAAHEASLQLHENYVAGGDDPAFKDFATESVKTVQSHLKHAKGMSSM